MRFSSCETIIGDIYITGEAFTRIDMTGIQTIKGSLSVANATMVTSINLPDLGSVTGSLEFMSNTILSTLNLAKLTKVNKFKLSALPALEKMGLTTGITDAEEIIISDTDLMTLDGLLVKSVKTFVIDNNKQVSNVSIGLKSVTKLLSISFNSPDVKVVLNDLVEAGEVNFFGVDTLSAKSLVKTESLTISSSLIKSIYLPTLKVISKMLVIDGNSGLESLNFRDLKHVMATFQITNNESLLNFGGFRSLKVIGGSVIMKGNFERGSFPELQKISGGFLFETSGSSLCPYFDDLLQHGKIKGKKYRCSSAENTSVSDTTSKTSYISSASSSTFDIKNESISKFSFSYFLVSAFILLGFLY